MNDIENFREDYSGCVYKQIFPRRVCVETGREIIDNKDIDKCCDSNSDSDCPDIKVLKRVNSKNKLKTSNCSKNCILQTEYDRFVIENKIKDNINNLKFYKGYESTSLRLFYCDKWYLSTYKKLNAFKSKWGSNRSFGKIFISSLRIHIINELTNKIIKNSIKDKDKVGSCVETNVEHILDNNKKENIKSKVLYILKNIKKIKNNKNKIIDDIDFYHNFYGKLQEQNIIDLAIYFYFLDNIDKNNSYIFFITNNHQNRIICKGTQIPELYLSGIYNSNLELNLDSKLDISFNFKNCEIEKLSFNKSDDLSLLSISDKSYVFNYFRQISKINIHIKKPIELNIKSINCINSYLSNLDYTDSFGIICFIKLTEDDHNYSLFSKYNCIKIIDKKYKLLEKIRGNQSCIVYRYIQLKNSNNKNMLKYLLYLYPEYETKFKLIETKLNKISDIIFKNYIQRYIFKRYVSRPREEFFVMKLAHEWHKLDRDNNKNSLYSIKKILLKQPILNIVKMINKI